MPAVTIIVRKNMLQSNIYLVPEEDLQHHRPERGQIAMVYFDV